MIRLSRRSLVHAGALVALAVPVSALQAQQEFPQTLYWGTGLIDIPVANVSPITGDFAFNYSGKHFAKDETIPKIGNYSNTLNSQLTFSMAFLGRFELGVAAFSSNPEEGFFGRGVIVREEDFKERGGIGALLIPSIAIGARNIGPYDHIDRYGVGYRLYPPTADDPDAKHVASSLHQNFKTNNTFYGVATKSLALADIRPNWPDLNFSLTVGYGNGLFKDDGGLGDRYAKHATGGLFYGLKTDFSPGQNLMLSLMAENNAWDYNLGGSLYWRGLRAGLYWTEVGAGSASPVAGDLASQLYNYSKVAFTVGWQSNIFALLRGDFLQNRAAELERQRQGLLAEIAKRQQRIAALELEINRYEAQNLLELEQRRAQAESELRAEREALRRLEERLRRVEQQAPPPTTTPPTTTPPTTPPPSGTPPVSVAPFGAIPTAAAVR